MFTSMLITYFLRVVQFFFDGVAGWINKVQGADLTPFPMCALGFLGFYTEAAAGGVKLA